MKLMKLILALLFFTIVGFTASCPKEAPQSFVLQNGLLEDEDFQEAKAEFDEIETPETGLGTHFNNTSCAACHTAEAAGGLTGGGSALTELRAGHFNDGVFGSLGGTLINLMAVNTASELESLPDTENLRNRFITISLFGDGFVEAVHDDVLRKIAKDQADKTNGRINGIAREVDILEAPGRKGVGRFGWASQHKSLLSFAADAYRSEMGITNPLFPEDNTFFGALVDDGIADPEDNGEDVQEFANFMRALSAPPRVIPANERKEIEEGDKLFTKIGCAMCHTATMKTMKKGEKINGGTFTLPEALGNKTFHPYSDFLLHDIGTGITVLREGMAPSLQGRVRTAALWGLNARIKKQPLLHDGSALTIEEAVQKHNNTAAEEREQFNRLSAIDRLRLLKFLNSL